MAEIEKRMTEDVHGASTIRNIYLDTPDKRLIRNSLDKPVYKEKFRIRGYLTAKPETMVFAEIKKKYKSVVYKRRIELSWEKAEKFLKIGSLSDDTQIGREIKYFFNFYNNLCPSMFITYDRQSFYDREFKVTFDENILYRNYDMSLDSSPYGKKVLEDGFAVMELKTPEAIPLWMSKILTQNKIYKTSFSKYGEAYKKVLKGEQLYEQFI